MLSLVTAATSEPLTLNEAKAHCRVSGNAQDAELSAWISAARGHVESATQRQLLEATHELRLDAFPCGALELLPAPLLSVVSVKYLDENGTEQTLASTVYLVQTPAGPRCGPGRISLAYGQYWPSIYPERGAVRIRFKAGYLATGGSVTAADQRAAVPGELRSAILLLIAEMNERRTVATTGTIVVPNLFAAESLMGPFRIIRY